MIECSNDPRQAQAATAAARDGARLAAASHDRGQEGVLVRQRRDDHHGAGRQDALHSRRGGRDRCVRQQHVAEARREDGRVAHSC